MQQMTPVTAQDPTLAAVIFDVDGTLVDSERDGHRPAFNAAFAEAGLDFRWDAVEYGELLAVTGGDRRIRHYLLGAGVAEEEAQTMAKSLHRRKTEIVTEMASQGQLRPRPGIGELLEELVHAGIRVAVATTGRSTWVMPLLATSFPEIQFETIVTGDDVPALKPDPSAYVIAMERLGVSPVEALAVEDSRNGLVAAHAADLDCLVIVNDYSREQDFSEAALLLDEVSDAGRRARVLSGPAGMGSDVRLDVSLLQRLIAVRGQRVGAG